MTLPINCPHTRLTLFTALGVLIYNRYDSSIPLPVDLFASLPLLGLKLRGFYFAKDFVVPHMGLKSLVISDSDGPSPTTFFRPSLELWRLTCDSLQARSLENINSICPRLRRLVIKREARDYNVEFSDWIEEDERDGPLELMHERLEELELQNLSRALMKVACRIYRSW